MFTPTIECIFLHIPKTAGLTVVETILNLDRKFGWFLGTNYKQENYLLPMTEGPIYIGHIGYKDALKSGVMDRAYWKRAFKFTFVRNPYERLVSLYGYNPPVGLYNVKHFDGRSVLFNKHIYGNQYNPMVDWIPSDIGFIGRIEYFEDDMNHLLTILGYEGEKKKFEKTNYSKHEAYTEYYKNPKTIAYVNEMYDEDFKRFGYKKMAYQNELLE